MTEVKMLRTDQMMRGQKVIDGMKEPFEVLIARPDISIDENRYLIAAWYWMTNTYRILIVNGDKEWPMFVETSCQNYKPE